MAKVKPDEKNMHAGHRARVLKSYSQIDLDVLSPHQVLEFILFYVFPRGDVNPLAHRLLDKFGTIQNVLDASVSDLCQVYGINKKSAQMIAGFVNIFDYYTLSKLSRKRALSTPDEVFEFCQELLRTKSYETLFAIALDARRRILKVSQLGENATNLVALDTHDVFEFLNEVHASNILFCHSHPDGKCDPTQNDIAGNDVLLQIISCMGVGFIDHIIIGTDGIFSMKNNQKIKNFA